MKSKKTNSPLPATKHIKPVLLAYVVEVEGQRYEIPVDKTHIYASAQECDICGQHVNVELSVSSFFEHKPGRYFEYITLQEE